MDDARAGDPDAEAAVVLKSGLVSLVSNMEGMTGRQTLEAAVEVLWRSDLNREVRGAKAIAEVVFGSTSKRFVDRVKKFERDDVCEFRRWGEDRKIYLMLDEALRVRLELKAQGRLT